MSILALEQKYREFQQAQFPLKTMKKLNNTIMKKLGSYFIVTKANCSVLKHS